MNAPRHVAMLRRLLRNATKSYNILCIVFGITLLMYTHRTCDVSWRKSPIEHEREYAHKAGMSAGSYRQEEHQQPREFVPRSTETIHIVEICHNKHALHRLITFMKSLLFYRTNPIHLHMLTNENTVFSATEYFRTWKIPHFRLSTYVRPDVESETRWIPYLHPAGHFAFKKLLLEKILPPTVEKVIFYDADIVMLTDIAHLWNLFQKFNSSQAIGMSYETQFWYKPRKGAKPFEGAWPAIDWGFNTGMILYDLGKLRRMNWPELWREEAKKELKVQGYALLAEQDILNAYFLRHPEILYRVSCSWNLQFGKRFNVESCPNIQDYKALHTTLSKLDETLETILPSKPVFQNLVRTFVTMEGAGFGEGHVAGRRFHRVFPYFYDFAYVRDFGMRDVCLVVAVTFDKLVRLREIAKTWTGPMCVLVFATDEQAQGADLVATRPNIAYHVMFRRQDEFTVPEKLLETTAIKLVHTTHFVLGDIRTIPSKGSYESMYSSLQRNNTYAAFPTFHGDWFRDILNWTKPRIIHGINKRNVRIAPQISMDIHAKWLTATKPFVARWNASYAKYVMMPKNSHPAFAMENRDRDYETISITNTSYVKGEVEILPDSFAIEMPDYSADPARILRTL